jgi:hypothetical protein
MRTNWRASVLASVVMVAALAGCSQAIGEVPGEDTGPATLLVQNDNWSAATVTLERLGMEYALGAVPSRGERRFLLPASFVPAADLRLAIELVTGEQHVSQSLSVSPGAEIIYRIDDAIALSGYRVLGSVNRRR